MVIHKLYAIEWILILLIHIWIGNRAHSVSVAVMETTRTAAHYDDQETPFCPEGHTLMADPIIAIATIREAARQAVLAHISVKNRLPEFVLAEHLWRSEYWFAHYELVCKERDD